MATWTGRKVSFNFGGATLRGTVVSQSAAGWFAKVRVENDGPAYTQVVPLADLVIEYEHSGQDAAVSR